MRYKSDLAFCVKVTEETITLRFPTYPANLCPVLLGGRLRSSAAILVRRLDKRSIVRAAPVNQGPIAEAGLKFRAAGLWMDSSQRALWR